MPEIQKTFHNLERKLLKTFEKHKEANIEELSKNAGMSLDQTRRTIEWLKSKKLISSKIEKTITITLGVEGRRAAREGLPERRLIQKIIACGGSSKMEELKKRFSDNDQEFSAALGNARKLGWIFIQPIQNVLSVKISENTELSSEEKLLKRLGSEDISIKYLTSDELRILSNLKNRPNYILEKESKKTSIKITNEGLKTLEKLGDEDYLEELTPDILISEEWKYLPFRPRNLDSPSPVIYSGKKHPIQRFIDEVREIFVSLGFTEIEGQIIQPCFWNFDALFIPQDHPAREMQDTFYLSGVKFEDIIDKESLKNVSKAHENGGKTGSAGWGYDWDISKSKDAVLRTHTTAVTVKYLADVKPKEARVFSIGRVFRNEKVTFKNLAEFYQIEGITVGEGVNLRNIMGLLSNFYTRLGLKKVKFWPTFFPYTEPSLQSMVYFEKLGKWVELCGMGIFRPEVTKPLGIDNPVLAWGGGLERLVMLRHNVSDIRELYNNNLGWLRRISLCR
jgi:phenylalanyl-tRNA synthetase alpha chain